MAQSASPAQDLKNLFKPTFRIKGIPRHWSETALYYSLKKRFQIEVKNDIQIYSLAPYVPAQRNDPSLLAATAAFKTCPVELVKQSSEKQEWAIRLSIEEDSTDTRVFFDTHFNDFTPYSSTHNSDGVSNDETELIDCLAIHGLVGHAFGSWKDPNSNYMWLRDSVAANFPKFKVWTYGYCSDLTSPNDWDLDQMAKDIKEKIRNWREREQGTCSATRALIFIAHSLGGILVQDVIISDSMDDDSGHSIINSTYGALFFGVPFQGMDFEALIETAENLNLRSFLMHLNRVNFEQHRQKQNKLFCEKFHFKDSIIKSFHERLESPTFIYDPKKNQITKTKKETKVVLDTSAAAGGRLWERNNSESLFSTHSGMIKFKESDEDNYGKVINILRKFDEQAYSVIQTRHKARAHQFVTASRNYPITNTFGTPLQVLTVPTEARLLHASPQYEDSNVDNAFSSPDYRKVVDNLPRYINPFFGRERELKTLVQILDSNKNPNIRRLCIYGMYGSGTKRICVNFADIQKAKYDIIHHIRSDNNEHALEDFTQIFKYYKPSSEPGWDDPKFIRRKLEAEQSWLLIFTGITAETQGYILRTLMPHGAQPPGKKFHILIATISPFVATEIAGRNGDILKLNAMGDESSYQMFLNRLPAHQQSFVTREDLIEILRNWEKYPGAIKSLAQWVNRPGEDIVTLQKRAHNYYEAIECLKGYDNSFPSFIDYFLENWKQKSSSLRNFTYILSFLHSRWISKPLLDAATRYIRNQESSQFDSSLQRSSFWAVSLGVLNKKKRNSNLPRTIPIPKAIVRDLEDSHLRKSHFEELRRLSWISDIHNYNDKITFSKLAQDVVLSSLIAKKEFDKWFERAIAILYAAFADAEFSMLGFETLLPHLRRFSILLRVTRSSKLKNAAPSKLSQEFFAEILERSADHLYDQGATRMAYTVYRDSTALLNNLYAEDSMLIIRSTQSYGMACLALGYFKEAKKIFQIILDPRNKYNWHNEGSNSTKILIILGMIHFYLEEPSQTRKYLNDAIHKLDKWSKSSEDWKRCMAECKLLEAMLAEKSGDYKSAKLSINDSLKIQKDLTTHELYSTQMKYTQKAQLRMLQMKYNQAKEGLERVLQAVSSSEPIHSKSRNSVCIVDAKILQGLLYFKDFLSTPQHTVKACEKFKEVKDWIKEDYSPENPGRAKRAMLLVLMIDYCQEHLQVLVDLLRIACGVNAWKCQTSLDFLCFKDVFEA